MTITPSLIEEIVHRILNVALPQRIVLFGSAASGTMDRDNDIDLLILETAPHNTREESIRIRQALRGLGFAFDVIVMAQSDSKKARTSLVA